MARDGKTERSDCGTSLVLELIGDRWSLIILREYVFLGKREYGHFLDLPEGISTNILADRLKKMVEIELFTRHPHPTNNKKYYYEITDKGFDLLVLIMEMARWSWKYVPGAFTPKEIKSLYLKDPKEFMKVWKKRAKQDSENYLKNAKI